MTAIATVLTIATAAAEPLTRATEVPELASMALLSVVLAGVSVAVRRAGARQPDVPPDDHATSSVAGAARRGHASR